MGRASNDRSGSKAGGAAAPAATPASEVIVYEVADGDVRVDVRVEQDTVWLTQRQMAEVFGTTPENVLMHLRNVFSSGELKAERTTKDFLAVRTEGKRQVRRNLKHYNLDAIISVGYRVNSKRGVQFRQWATHTLREHLVRGYTMNEQRLANRGLREARETLDLLSRTLQNQALVTDTGRAVLDVIGRYADTWRLLLEYDENRLQAPIGRGPSTGVLDHDTATDAIARFKLDLMERQEASPLFGNPRGDALAGILGNIEQTMFGESLYRSREEKAAHLLYFIVKDHPFTDGNKRIGSLLFLLYLEQENIEHALNPQAVTALTLLIAESDPTVKDLMVRLIMNLLMGSSAFHDPAADPRLRDPSDPALGLGGGQG
ncbi:MAG: virulence protein RhuM/Fic/DOC family protein [Gemmatimonadota bacterium]|uniref:virulence protein RhuM/Fic/DOC family protein n=1 Tax=Candidatus Palauibacter scopulicola TaxID=3056741 RepID=UPI00238EF7BC|nr:virulence protein RhuM/Fic/DOC family protein [Candidatus Palauibacter scopulicola]MDE2663486.1 virulence protein RhuM/Fic/DOC family protein [Candidatus Palauibacter scopulicola]